MKLDNAEFKRFRELKALIKAGKATEADKAEFEALQAKRNSRGSNDLSWWNNYPELLKDVVKVPFNYLPGAVFPIYGPTNNDDFLRPGVLAKAVLRPAIGRSVADSDAFNSQIRQLWLDMHRKYRGLGTYEKADLAMMIIAVNSVFETVAKFERIYGVINTYHVGNRSVPYALKEALNIGDNLEEELANFRYNLNLRISKLRQLCLPQGMSVLQSDIIAIGNIFKDAADRRAFLYLFDTDLYGVYDGSLSITNTGGCVQFKKFSLHQSDVTQGGNSAFVLADVTAILDEQIDALLNDDDIARMCSDLIAAYGPENVLQLSYLPEDYKVEPVEDYERQIQFHNLTLCGPVCSIYDASVIPVATASTLLAAGVPIVIYQNNNSVFCRLGVGEDSYVNIGGGSGNSMPLTDKTNQRAKNAEVIFDTWVEQPGEAEIMCGTRYTAVAGPQITYDAAHWHQEVFAFGTKVATSMSVYYFDESSRVFSSFTWHGSVVEVGYFRNQIFYFMKMTQMDWHPTLYINSNNTDFEVFGDLDNFTKISGENLARIHEVALLSGYKIPMVSKD